MGTAGKLQGKVAQITGGGGYIGTAIAELLATEGAKLVLADDVTEKVETTAAVIKVQGGEAIAVTADVSDAAQCEAAVTAGIEAFGALHVLVNTAAVITPDGTVPELDLADWQRALDVNLTGAFLMCKYAIPRIKSAGGGAVVNITSQLGHMAVPARAPYTTTKAALIHLTRVLAIDHAADNIRVNSVSPGVVATQRPMRRFATEEEFHHARGPTHLLNRVAQPEEVAKAVLFLACDDASFTTATDVLVDGGYIAFKGSVESPKG